MAENNDTLKNNIIQAFGTLIVREFFLKLFSFIGQIFLARMLVPEDFGVYVILVFLIGLFALFADVGLSLAIIQKKEKPSSNELTAVFFIKTLLALILILLIFVFSPFAKVLYPSFTDTHILMLQLLSFIILFANLRSIPIALLERKVKYNVISFVDVAGVVFYYIVALVCASLQIGVWSLIIATLAKEFIETIIIYGVQPFFPKLQFRLQLVKKMIKFGIFIQGNSLVNFINSSIIPLLGGRLSGTYSVGLLDFANNLASLPEIIAINFGRVAFAGFSRIQEQRQLLFSSINKSINMLAILLYIFPIVIFAFGEDLVRVIYTEKWLPAVPALYWFAGAAFFQPIITSIGQGILAIGKSKEILRVTIISAVVGWIAAYILLSLYGFVGIAIASFITSFVLCFLYIQILRKYGFHFKFFSLFNKLLIAALTLCLCFMLNSFTPSTILLLTVKLVLAAVMYIILFYFLSRNDFIKFIAIIKSWKK